MSTFWIHDLCSCVSGNLDLLRLCGFVCTRYRNMIYLESCQFVCMQMNEVYVCIMECACKNGS